MSKQWTAEHTVEPEQARLLIESQFPELAPITLELVGEGWDNIVYRVNRNYVFRFPRRQIGSTLVAVEEKILPLLNHRLPLPIPKLLFFGKPTPEYRWSFLGYNFLQGRSACAAHLNNLQREELAVPLAQFLKTLHAIPEQEALNLGAQYDKLGKLNVPFRYPQAQQNIAKIREIGLFDNCDALLEILETLKDLQDTGKKTLAHGDLYARHLLVDKHHQLSGIIDWGDAHVGNPAIDLQIIFSFLPQQAHQQFFDVYGHIDHQTLQIALFRALCQLTTLSLYSHDVSDTDLLRECLFGLQLIAPARL
jgi:aminoglycoside phosphotransferase (APT) family kinase protein